MRAFRKARALCLAIALASSVLSSPALAQETPEKAVGTIERLTDQQFTLRSDEHVYTLHADRTTRVHKDGMHRGLSALRLGDEVSVQIRQEAPGRLVAETVWADKIEFRAQVARTDSGSFDVLLPRSEDPESAYRKGISRVWTLETTRFGVQRQYLTEGSDVSVVGVITAYGNVDAIRIVVYENGMQLTIDRPLAGEPAP